MAQSRRDASIRPLGALGVFAAFLLAGASPALAAPADSAAPDLSVDCTTISDATARLNCWDGHAHATTVQKTAAKKRDFGLSAKQAAPTPARRPRRQHEAKVKVAHAETENNDRRVTLTLASVDQGPGGRLLLTATDGAIWEQTDSDVVADVPSPGATMTVRRGPLGGFMCDVTRWQPVRCQRDR